MRRALLGGVLAGMVAAGAACAEAPAAAAPDPGADAGLCEAAIGRAEAGRAVPRRLMSAIAMAESGRALPGGRVAPWPWTINAGGVGSYFPTAEAAISAVEALQQAGVRSIDVGCMQVNLMHHPAAFATLRDAFDPATNAAYAARFLLQLRGSTPAWPDAVGAYHSRDPDLAAAYRQRVAAVWPDAAAYGLGSSAPVVEAASANRMPEFNRRLADAARDRAALRSARVGAAGATPSRLRPASRGSAIRVASVGSALRAR